MRIDKFLKIALLFKTRSSAEKAIENACVLINGKPAKPATDVKAEDLLVITFPDKTVTYRIKELQEHNVSRQKAKELYDIINEELHDF